jgi:protease-4
MNFSDNLGALIYLKNRVHKWKNIALLFAIFSIALIFKMFFDVSSDVIGNSVALVKIENVITEDDHRSKILKEIANDSSILAVIVRLNSPGGTIVGSEILFKDLLAIKAKKPLVVLMDSVSASGAYMASLASDYVIAHNGTITGSIGVLMESPDVSILANKVGVKFNSYKSSPLKGSPSMFEKSTPMVDRVINESIYDSYKFFVELVKERRGNKLNSKFYNIIFDGRIFTGRQALEMGLVDKVGGIEDVERYLLLNKIDVNKIPIQEVEIVEKDNKIIDKFLNILPFYQDLKGRNNQSKIMAIMN